MSERKPPPRPPRYDAALIEDVAEAVYRALLGEADVARMIARDKDDGTKLRRRAQCYAPVVRATFDALRAREGAR